MKGVATPRSKYGIEDEYYLPKTPLDAQKFLALMNYGQLAPIAGPFLGRSSKQSLTLYDAITDYQKTMDKLPPGLTGSDLALEVMGIRAKPVPTDIMLQRKKRRDAQFKLKEFKKPPKEKQ